MARRLLTLICAISVVAALSAQGWADDIKFNLRVGLSIGGAAPVNMPSTIRTLESYDFKVNPQIGIDAEKPLDGNWSILGGVRLERKGMEIGAKVKNYNMTIVRGGETLSGRFTGYNHTVENQWEVAIPVSAAYTVDKVRIQAGPYVAYVTECGFSGYASDGYLRVGDPTGPKVELGTSESDRGSYDFADEMRRFQWGVQFGADWSLSEHWGMYGMVEWGLNGIHKSSFHTVEQTLYPIFGTIGLLYNF